MLIVNISFNFIISLLSLIGIAQSKILYIQYLKYTGYIYFTTDTILELFMYKRYYYIPHHMISLLNIYAINDTYPYMSVFYVFFLAESTGFVSNIRCLLKQNNILSISLDMYLFVYYIFLRLILIPIICMDLQDYHLMFYSSIMIYIMSCIWSYQWGKSIYKYRKKINSIKN